MSKCILQHKRWICNVTPPVWTVEESLRRFLFRNLAARPYRYGSVLVVHRWRCDESGTQKSDEDRSACKLLKNRYMSHMKLPDRGDDVFNFR